MQIATATARLKNNKNYKNNKKKCNRGASTPQIKPPVVPTTTI